jgi:hypothetical protein
MEVILGKFFSMHRLASPYSFSNLWRMQMTNKLIKIMLALGALALVLLALIALRPVDGKVIAADPTATPTPTLAPTPTLEVPFEQLWMKSPHNDAKAEAFVHWDTTADKSVPVDCATCHSTKGYQDFLGADGSAVGKVDKPAPIGTTIQCAACHNAATQALTSVQFLTTNVVDGKAQPVVISGLGPEARCMVCHQGRATMTTVDDQIAKFKATDVDAVVAPIKDAAGKDVAFGFINVHYFAAAITLYGNEVKGGYQYAGKAYDSKNDHVAGFNTCVGCHDPHTLEVKVKSCAECHTGVTTVASLQKVREPSSTSDYDGDGNVKEGMAEELAGMRDALYKGIQAYAKDVAKTGIIYDPATYPYFMQDKDGDGKADKTDKGANISYSTWTARLLKAAYNLQVSTKDPGAFAHGNKYIAQLLYDSLEDLNTKLPTKIDMSKMRREDAGHFAGDSEAFRHWDESNMQVPGSCARCHSASGLPQFIKEGATITNPAANGFQCTTCHDGAKFPAVYTVNSVPFPSGATVSFGDGVPANLCLECHQGRESTVSVTKAVKDLDPDKPSDKIGFRNVHYFAAGATMFGTQTKGIFEYTGKTYVGQFMHTKGVSVCTDCHDKHVLVPDTKKCVGCHKVDDPIKIRLTSKDDFDGDGNATEGIGEEVATYKEVLYKALQAYAKDVAGTGILYSPTAYPYFFADKDNDGKPDVDAKGATVGYNAWTPRLLEAAYNYQYSIKDPGGYVHNGKYIMQAMYDSIEDLNSKLTTKIDISKMIRPK